MNKAGSTGFMGGSISNLLGLDLNASFDFNGLYIGIRTINHFD